MEKLLINQLFYSLTFLIPLVIGGYHQDRVLLSDINVLTLKHGYNTNSRRSAPVPQLKCVGGTAGCNKFTPQVVQCYNRGSDGIDVQWECKTDMDNAYRFGEVEVTCEGYDYPDDMYVLKGSCGLEYKLDLTKEGYDQERGHSNQYSSNHGKQQQHYDSQDDYGYGSKKKSKSGFGDIVMLGVVALIIYGIYKSCISTGHQTNQQDSTGYPNNQQGHSQGPPPPGFRSEYMPGSDHCSGSSYTTTNGMGGLGGSGLGGSGLGGSGLGGSGLGGNTGTGGGFWTGAATGGLLGYLFGGRNNGYNNGYGQRSWFGNTGYGNAGYGNTGSSWFGSGNRNTGSSWFGSGHRSTGSSSFSSGSSSSTGTRSASGFGGTKRR